MRTRGEGGQKSRKICVRTKWKPPYKVSQSEDKTSKHCRAEFAGGSRMKQSLCLLRRGRREGSEQAGERWSFSAYKEASAVVRTQVRFLSWVITEPDSEKCSNVWRSNNLRVEGVLVFDRLSVKILKALLRHPSLRIGIEAWSLPTKSAINKA